MDLSVIFESDIDCPICRAKARGMAIPHRPHHPRCSKNTTTRGKGMNDGRGAEVVASEKAQAVHAAAIRKPLTSGEKLSASNVTKEAVDVFMRPRPNCTSKNAKRGAENENTESTSVTMATESSTVGGEEGAYVPTAEDFKFEVIMRVTAVPTEVHVPRAVHALASYVTDTCLGSKRCVENLKPFFTNMTVTVPPIADNTSALYDSIVGQELLVVDLELFFPSNHLRCPRFQKTSPFSPFSPCLVPQSMQYLWDTSVTGARLPSMRMMENCSHDCLPTWLCVTQWNPSMLEEHRI